MNRGNIRIAIVGRALSGKDVVSDYLSRKHGFVHVSSGDIVREHIHKNELGEPVRELMQRVANEMRLKYGVGVLVEKAMTQNETASRLVISGLRSRGEIDKFIEYRGLVVAIDTPIEVRYSRSTNRGRPGDNITLEQFIKEEAKDSYSDDPISQNVNYALFIAHHKIVNDTGLAQLEQSIDRLVYELEQTTI